MGDLRGILDRARKELLELSPRNRLLDTPRGRPRALLVEVVDERSAEIFDLLVGQGRKLGFLAQPEIAESDEPDTAQDAFSGLAPPEEADLDKDGVAARHRDLWLQTALAPERLQSRLLQLYYEARTTYEERGVNVLYLALGFLEWYETPSSNQARHAPLLLVPVTLTRGSAHESFRVSFSEEEIIANITLREKLKEFSLQLPELEETGDLRPAEYFAEVRFAIAGEPRFEVLPDRIVLGLFSFSRLLMYRDLDPTNWPAGAELEFSR